MRAEQVSIAQRWRRPCSDLEYRLRRSDAVQASENALSARKSQFHLQTWLRAAVTQLERALTAANQTLYHRHPKPRAIALTTRRNAAVKGSGHALKLILRNAWPAVPDQ